MASEYIENLENEEDIEDFNPDDYEMCYMKQYMLEPEDEFDDVLFIDSQIPGSVLVTVIYIS